MRETGSEFEADQPHPSGYSWTYCELLSCPYPANVIPYITHYFQPSIRSVFETGSGGCRFLSPGNLFQCSTILRL